MHNAEPDLLTQQAWANQPESTESHPAHILEP